MTRSRRGRLAVAVAGAAWLLGSVLACGGSGEEEEPSPAAAEATPPPPPPPASPFAEHSVTIDALGSSLRRLATTQPERFADGNFGSAQLSSRAVTAGGAPAYVEIQLHYRATPGMTAAPVYATLIRTPDGEVYVAEIVTGVATAAGADALRPPEAVTALAQTLRLQVMSPACALPTLTARQAIDVLGVDSDTTSRRIAAAEVAERCPAARDAFNAATLALSDVWVRVVWAGRTGLGELRYLRAELGSGSEAVLRELRFVNER